MGDNLQQAGEPCAQARMAYLLLEQDTFGDFIEEHFYTLVSHISPDVFLDKLRGQRVFNQYDFERISNCFVYPTRRDKAREFLNILLMKGFNGFTIFMNDLEYEYPHVFKMITGIEARQPPQGFVQHVAGRISQNLDHLVQLRFDMGEIECQRNGFQIQMQELQKLLEFSENEKRDLEREVASLQQYLLKNKHLNEKLKMQEIEIHSLKDENREFMKLNIQFRDDKENLHGKLQQFLKDNDNMTKKLEEKTNELDRIRESRCVLEERFQLERQKSMRLIEESKRIRASTSPNRGAGATKYQLGPNSASMTAKVELLECDLEAQKDKVSEVLANQDIIQTELDREMQISEILRQDKLNLQNECDKTRSFLKYAEIKNNDYFTCIQQLEKEKRKAEEEKILAQQKCWKITDQKNQLFEAKHQLETQINNLRQKNEDLRTKYRFHNPGIQNTGVNNHWNVSPGGYQVDPPFQQPCLQFSGTEVETSDDETISEHDNDNENNEEPRVLRRTCGVRPPIPAKPCINTRAQRRLNADSLIVNIPVSMKKANAETDIVPNLPEVDNDPVCRSDDENTNGSIDEDVFDNAI